MMEEELTASKIHLKEMNAKLEANNNNKNVRRNFKFNDNNDLLSETYNGSNTDSSSVSYDDSTILNESSTNKENKAAKSANERYLYKNTNYDSDFESEELENLNKLVS